MLFYSGNYIVVILLVFLLSCGGGSDKKPSGGVSRGVLGSSLSKRVNITRTEYYRDYEQSYDGKTRYIGSISKEEALGVRHIRLYYSASRVVREEEYDGGGNLIRYTKPVYSSAGEKVSEKWYDSRDGIILERFYRGVFMEGETIFSASGKEEERVKYIYDDNNVLLREEHYNVYSKLLFYKEFEYKGGLLVRSHFYAPDGSKISTHKEYHKAGEGGLGYDDKRGVKGKKKDKEESGVGEKGNAGGKER